VGSPQGDFDPACYWEDRLQQFDLAAVGYRGLGLPYNRWLYRVRHAVFQGLVRAVNREWDRAEVLDIGSGTGFYVDEWQRLGASVTGSDLTRVAVDNLARTFPGSQFVQFDITEQSPFSPESFDAISAVDVLFHIVDDSRYEAAFRNITALLKVGGYFFFSENFVRGETIRASHQVSRSFRDVERVLTRSGLDLILRRPMFVLMNTPIDSKSRLLNAYWRKLAAGLSRFPGTGDVVGASLYPLERFLVSVCTESPSTEFAVCRKPSRPELPQHFRG
jgi:SAM-dependent methyltransferase